MRRLSRTPRRSAPLAAMAAAALLLSACSQGVSADDVTAIDTDLIAGTAEVDGGPFADLPTFRKQLADELGVPEDQLQDAAETAYQQVLQARLDAAVEAGLTDPDEVAEVIRDSGITDPAFIERAFERAGESTRSAADWTGQMIQEHTTDESAERAGNWLVRTGSRVGELLGNFVNGLVNGRE